MTAPSPPVPIAVAQFAPTADTDANLAQIRGMVAEAAPRGARLVLFPEYSTYFIDPFDATLAAHAQDVNGPFVTSLIECAATHGVTIVAGILESATDHRRVRNTVVAVDGRGVLAVYRKLHLYDAFGQRESDWVQPGPIEPPQTFVLDGFTVGMMTCYDLRFPEVARTLVDAGVDVILVPAAWIRGPLKEQQWATLLAARAIENTAYVAAADHPPPLGVGASRIIDPLGVTLAGIGTGTDVAVADLDRDVLDRVRTVNPALALRRFAVVARPDSPE